MCQCVYVYLSMYVLFDIMLLIWESKTELLIIYAHLGTISSVYSSWSQISVTDKMTSGSIKNNFENSQVSLHTQAASARLFTIESESICSEIRCDKDQLFRIQ